MIFFFFNLNSVSFLLCLTPLCGMIDVWRVSLLSPTLWHDWCIEGFPVISYLHLTWHSELVSVSSYICLFSCGRSPTCVSWRGLLHDSFPGCQLSLLFLFQCAWLIWSKGDTLLCLQAALPGGQQKLCGPCFPAWTLWRKKHSCSPAPPCFKII